MGKGTNEEREFSENIERLLAGEEVEVGEDVSEDYRTAINFAQKLTEFRAEPSSVFKAQLKERLLSKLVEQEVEAARQEEKVNWFWEGLRNLIPQSPVWRTVTATFVVILVAAGVLWRTGMFTPSPVVEVVEALVVEEAPIVEEAPALETFGRGGVPEEGAPSLAVEGAIQLLLELETVQLEPIVYPFGETAEIELVFKNVSSEAITLALFPPPIEIVRARTWEVIRSFTEGDETLALSPSETVNYTLVWNQQDNSGEQVVPGWYSLRVSDVVIYKDTEPTETLRSFQPFNLLVQFPQGALEKVIESGQTQTVNGIAITLERVELSTLEAKFYAFNLPSDYSLPQGPNLPPPSLMALHAHAEYSFDGGPMKDAGLSGIRFLDNGMEHSWIMLDPVPKDAKELTFVITKLGEWEGPWEFSIPLQE